MLLHAKVVNPRENIRIFPKKKLIASVFYKKKLILAFTSAFFSN